jgi:hypothetical protein
VGVFVGGIEFLGSILLAIGVLSRLAAAADVAAPQLTAYDHLAGSINAVHLEDRLRNIKANRRN